MQTETTPVEGTPGAAANAGAEGSGQGAAGGTEGTEGQGAQGAAGTEGSGEPAGGEAGGQPEGGAPEDGAKPDGEGDGAGDDPPKYEFQVPEGIEITPEWNAELTTFASTNKLSPEQAQAVVDMGVRFQQQVIDRINAAVSERTAQWATQAKADPVVGGKDYEANVQLALNAVAQFGDAELTQLFDEYSLGNNPAMLRAFVKIGKAISESGGPDGLGRESTPAPVNAEQARADRMYAQANKVKGPKQT